MPTDTTSDFGWQSRDGIALADIIRASLALRAVQPDLEAWSGTGAGDGAEQPARPVWPVILAGWGIATMLLIATIGGLGLLLFA